MASTVYWGSSRQSKLDANETLPAKLDLILEQLHLRDRVKKELVVLKIHTGSHIGYSTIHPVFLRKVVKAIKEGGGEPVVADTEWDVHDSASRGYTAETLGCPIYPISGPSDKYFYDHHKPYKSIQDWRVGGLIQDATFLVNFAHAKGHPSCGYGGAIKNLALGCMSGKTRAEMHDSMHYDPYWFAEKCTDASMRQAIIDVCPFGAIVQDRENPQGLHMHFEGCNQCGRCLQVAPPGSLKIDAANFHTFQEACAISTSVSMSTFAPGKAMHMVLATHMTPVCDCFGFTSMPILSDAGIFGSDDIVAVEQAVLDMTAELPLLEENVPTSMEVHTRVGHPLRWLHGPHKDPYKVVEYAEQLGLGTRQYDLVDVLPVAEFQRTAVTYISAN
jgi:uncharacterized Fe-S center protein